MKTFEELEINEDIMRSVKELGFTTPFPIQAEAIPVLLRGTDVIGQAHTCLLYTSPSPRDRG